jgi:retron-type reverse transcriptase
VNLFEIETKSQLSKLLAVTTTDLDEVVAKRGNYYYSRRIPKTDGSCRVLHVPKGALRLLQQKIKRHILDQIGLPNCVHGGVIGRSVLTNARPHVNKAVVFSLDIKDFFPSVDPKTVHTIFEVLGFRSEISDLLTQCTTWDQELPQGAPCSTSLANLAMTRVDIRISNLAKKFGFAYTRYVDDLTVSGSKRLLGFRNLIRRIIQEEGFQIKPEKTRTMHSGMRQTVTKLTVNQKINLPRENRQRIRQQVIAFSARPRQQRRNDKNILGQLSWVSSVNPDLGSRLRERARLVTKDTKMRQRISASAKQHPTPARQQTPRTATLPPPSQLPDTSIFAGGAMTTGEFSAYVGGMEAVLPQSN